MSKPENKAMEVPEGAAVPKAPRKNPRAQNGSVGGKPVGSLPNFGTVNSNKVFQPEVQPSA